MSNSNEKLVQIKLGKTIGRRKYFFDYLKLLGIAIAVIIIPLYIAAFIDLNFPRKYPYYDRDHYTGIGLSISAILLLLIIPFWLNVHYRRLRDIIGPQKYSWMYITGITMLLLNPFFFVFVGLAFLVIPGNSKN